MYACAGEDVQRVSPMGRCRPTKETELRQPTSAGPHTPAAGQAHQAQGGCAGITVQQGSPMRRCRPTREAEAPPKKHGMHSCAGDAAWQDLGNVSTHLALIRLWPLSLNTWACQDVQAVHLHDDRGPAQGSPWHLHQGWAAERMSLVMSFAGGRWPLLVLGCRTRWAMVPSETLKPTHSANSPARQSLHRQGHQGPQPVHVPAVGCRARWAVVQMGCCADVDI